MGEKIRIEAYYSGHVQGVGFRFLTTEISGEYPEITGFVRNLPDGRVEVVAEGPEVEADAFLTAVEEGMGPYIRGVDKQKFPATGEFAGFTVAR